MKLIVKPIAPSLWNVLRAEDPTKGWEVTATAGEYTKVRSFYFTKQTNSNKYVTIGINSPAACEAIRAVESSGKPADTIPPVVSPSKATVVQSAPAAAALNGMRYYTGTTHPGSHGYTVSGIKNTTGMEGHGFIARLHRNGKPVAEIADYGDGGMMHMHWTDVNTSMVERDVTGYDNNVRRVKMTSEQARLHDTILAMPRIPASPKQGLPEMDMTDEIFLCDLVQNTRTFARLRRIMATNLVFQQEGKTMQMKTADVGASARKMAVTDPANIVLNTLDDEQFAEFVAKLG